MPCFVYSIHCCFFCATNESLQRARPWFLDVQVVSFYVASDAVFHVACNISIMLLLISRTLRRQSKMPSYLPISQLLPHTSGFRLKQKNITNFPSAQNLCILERGNASPIGTLENMQLQQKMRRALYFHNPQTI